MQDLHAHLGEDRDEQVAVGALFRVMEDRVRAVHPGVGQVTGKTDAAPAGPPPVLQCNGPGAGGVGNGFDRVLLANALESGLSPPIRHRASARTLSRKLLMWFSHAARL